MGLESIISIIPTVGNIIGQLLGQIFQGNAGGQNYRYSISLGASPVDEIDFKVEGKDIVMANRTADEVCLSFPAQNGYTGETILVPSCTKLPVSDIFKNCAQNDVNTFNLTAGVSPFASNDLGANQKAISLSSSGMVEIGGSAKQLGSYISAKITKKGIEFQLPSIFTLEEVVYLNVAPAEGNEAFHTSNYIPETKGQSVVIPLSLLLVEGKQAEVSVTLSCISENHSRLIEDCCNKYGIVSMTENEIRQLEKMPKINL